MRKFPPLSTILTLGLLGSSSRQEAPPANEALIKERDEALKGFERVGQEYEALRAEYETAGQKITALEATARDFDAKITALTTAKEAAEKAKTDFEAAMPAQIRTEAIRLAASQGVKIENVPPPGGGGADTGDKETALKAAITAMQAERDPVKKGILLKALDALRAAA